MHVKSPTNVPGAVLYCARCRGIAAYIVHTVLFRARRFRPQSFDKARELLANRTAHGLRAAERGADRFLRSMAIEPVWRIPIRLEQQLLFELAGPVAGKRLLDVGCAMERLHWIFPHAYRGRALPSYINVIGLGPRM